jgi:hypothetical protein
VLAAHAVLPLRFAATERGIPVLDPDGGG